MSPDPAHVARLYEIAAFERPLTPAERYEAGFVAMIDTEHVSSLWDRAAFERPLGEAELTEVLLDLAIA